MLIYEALRAVPQEAQKEIKGGRLSGMTDINPMWRIKSLTEQYGAAGTGWYYTITGQRLEAAPNGEVAAFVTIELFVKTGDAWSAPIVGIGGSKFVSNERTGAYVSDECFKMALTDAISVACKALGMGADVYFKADRTKYAAVGGDASTPAQTAPIAKSSPKRAFLREWLNDADYCAKLFGRIAEAEAAIGEKFHLFNQLDKWFSIWDEDKKLVISRYNEWKNTAQ